MQFVYHENASQEQLIIEGDLHKYLFKVRRIGVNEKLYLRNLIDHNLYQYSLISIDKKKAILQLESFEEKVIAHSQKLHIGWCIVDPKTVEKMLPSLNEIGIDKITFILCQFSQKNFTPHIERLEKILINSSQQCGRSILMQLDTCKDLKTFFEANPQSYYVDFTTELKQCETMKEIETIVIGNEGGFSSQERELFCKEKIVGFNTPTILKSETAVLAVASKILL